MEVDIQHRPAYAMAIVNLAAGESIKSEPGAMVSMSSNVSVETTSAAKKDGGMVSGFLKGLARMVAGENFFQNIFTANNEAGKITLAPGQIGDIEVHQMDGATGLMIQSASYLACHPDIELDTKFGGASSFFGGEGMFMMKATGTGPMIFNSFGGIKTIDVKEDGFVVDTGHIVAFEDTLKFSVTKFGGGLLATIFGGEGLVCTFKGTGRLWIQTRNPAGFGEAIASKLPMREH